MGELEELPFDWNDDTTKAMGLLFWPVAVLCPTDDDRRLIENTFARVVYRSGGQLAMPMFAVDPKLASAPPSAATRYYKDVADMPPRVSAMFRAVQHHYHSTPVLPT